MKAYLPVEMPNNCMTCDGWEFCKMYEFASKKRSANCPIVQMPDRIDAEKKAEGYENLIDRACNALTDSICVSGNDAETNMHWVRKLKTEAKKIKEEA